MLNVFVMVTLLGSDSTTYVGHEGSRRRDIKHGLMSDLSDVSRATVVRGGTYISKVSSLRSSTYFTSQPTLRRLT